jgi:hypothetical protein
MSKKNEKLIDVIEPEMSFQIEESGEVDGEHILAKVKGVFFCPNGKSRNNRFYPEALWEKALGDATVQQKLKSRTMFGTVGHETELNDKAILEGRISHIVTNAYINEDGKGMGEALILNTPAGRVLNTIMRAGSQVFVSSRAEGRFKGTKNGMPIVDEDSYKLDTWDFVLNPGFTAANPKLVEELNNIQTDNTNQGDKAMNETLEKVIKENVALKEELTTTSKKVTSLEEALSPIQEENNHVKEQLATAEETISKLDESNKELETSLVEAKEIVSVVEEMGDSVTEVKEALEKAVNYIDTLHEEVGTKEEITSTINEAITFKEEMDAIGSVEEIKSALKIGEEMLDAKIETERVAKVKELAEKCSVSETSIEKLLNTGMEEDAVVEFFANLVEKKKDEEEDEEDEKEDKKKVKKDDEEEEVLDENINEGTPSVDRSRLTRIMEQFNR